MNAEIIIVTYGQPELELKCLESIGQYTNLIKHKLTIVDNFVRDKNLGALWNELIEKSDREYICLLNSDTVVEAGWLDNLIECAENHKADAVGPTTNKCGYQYQMVPRGNFCREYEQLSGFCLLLRRSAWLAAKGFREDAPFYGQESNLLRRLRHKVLCGRVFVHHAGGASVKASSRFEEERALSAYWWPRNTKFDWKNRLAILGSPGSPFPLWVGINQAVREFGREGMAAKHFDFRTVTEEDLRKFNPTIIIFAGKVWDSKILDSFKVPKAVWYNDLRPGNRGERLKGFDRIFLCFKNCPVYSWKEWQAYAGGTPISYMPQGSVISTELTPFKPERDVIFIGAKYSQDRKSAIHYLRALWLNENLREKRITIENQSRELYRQSRFVLSMSPIVPWYTSIRLYNIMAYGGLALTEYFEGLNFLFKNEKHLLTWKKLEEAQDIIDRWKINEAACEVIRKRAWRLQQAKHTVAARLMNMVANLTTPDQTFWGEEAP